VGCLAILVLAVERVKGRSLFSRLEGLSKAAAELFQKAIVGNRFVGHGASQSRA
jgi:hypothetical protein